MSHTYSLAMTRPRERFGFSQPIGRQLAQHSEMVWYVALWVVLFFLIATYVGFMITASAKGFQLRDAESHVERLRTEARSLETQVATLSSVQQLSERAQSLGFVAVERIETLNTAGHSYALAR